MIKNINIFNLSQKRILITGATGGIGQGLVSLLSDLDAILCITGRRKNVLDNLKLKYKNIHIIEHDLNDIDSTNSLVDKAQEVLGSQIDGVICNAGVTSDNIGIKMNDEEWNKVIKTNLTSNFVINRAAIKAMLKSKIHGSIVNISSVIAHTGNIGQTNYAASKAGLEGMSRSLAHEVASRNIRINCIAPGFIISPMTDSINPDRVKLITDKIPMKRLGTPEDVSAAVAFLLSDAAKYITGTTIHINGGLYM
ncbi:3-oxoacyl-ACP reductase FabG [Lyticum sinuosum]|uniref:3-oxoacyl-[acyl-carrier-protein] reductase FabG n=1 Tax=Lyticum sinuosum TaxID=1332059 RepID=A0AAE4VLE2_9RICK|nr:3-oxoacyl-ACP reductase FabG [Lyticum sinuosum]MDZ5760886.1 3-oxoacyl-[acyl-carrier-protein] reductase FabG [Lyticum sinuosum]